MRGETVVICRSLDGRYLILPGEQVGQLTAPTKQLEKQEDFTSAIDEIIQSLCRNKVEKHFRIEGFLRMESVITEETFSQAIRMVYLVSYQGKEEDLYGKLSLPKDILLAAAASQTDERTRILATYVKYLEDGNPVFPMEILVRECSPVIQPNFKSEKQKAALTAIHKRIIS